MGPGNRLGGGRTKAHWAMQELKELSPYICDDFRNFLSGGTKFCFMFSGDVAACGASDQFTLINAR